MSDTERKRLVDGFSREIRGYLREEMRERSSTRRLSLAERERLLGDILNDARAEAEKERG